jgi:hypothetical protein
VTVTATPGDIGCCNCPSMEMCHELYAGSCTTPGCTFTAGALCVSVP